MIKPSVQREITIDLPDVLVESLGIGAHVLAQYLTSLAEVGEDDPSSRPPPLPVLCRICERQILPWWFEKHTELCLQEHRAEMEIQIAQESLTEHRSAIVKVLDALEVQSRRLRSGSNESNLSSPAPMPEYKGQVIGPSSQPSSGTPSGRSSPAVPQPRGRESSASGASGYSHHRARSFAVRRPLSRIVELVLDLCDTALEISTPIIKDTGSQATTEIRTQSPQSESRISQVLGWQSPSAGTLEQEQGLSLLCDDTANFCKAKVEAVFRHRRILEYSERIRIEFHVLVQECIEAAIAKAARIAAGELSDSTEGNSSQGEEEIFARSHASGLSPQPFDSNVDDFSFGSFGSAPATGSLALAFQNNSDPAMPLFPGRRVSSPAGSSRSNSPHGSKTPRSGAGSLTSAMLQKRNSIVLLESDAGMDSDSSLQSSVISGPRRADSPGAELSLSRVASSRDRKRRSLALPSLKAASRQQSPNRAPVPPLSPLRMMKPRLPAGADGVASPITSPGMSMSEFPSPMIRAQNNYNHHRRQSSAALGDIMRAPPSPRLAAISSKPQPKMVQTSIKDFEIIKPISKGAFGSVYLAKKKSTGDYYAVKVLKKADMVAKNQVTNVKAERAIMMWQGESDFVAKLYWTFASKDYLFLVMEYLNGGDCASLIKTLGGLPEDWAKKYLAEVVLGVQHLHKRQIVHRDLKPDNLLIDQKGHLKLTDFGLSRVGLIGRQKRMQTGKPSEAPDLLKAGPFRRVPSGTSSRSTSFDFNGVQSPMVTPSLTPALTGDVGQPSYFNLNRESSQELARKTSGQRSDSGDSDVLQNMLRRFSIADEPLGYQRREPIEEETESEGAESPDPYVLQPVTSNSSQPAVSTPPPGSGMLPPPMALFDPDDSTRRFVGTPDYLAPETINGVVQDEMSDWWSLGCILFESLYGFPPFHADTPEAVFQNILSREIHWPDDEDCPVSDEAKDLMNKLMCLDPKERLGSNNREKYANGGDEVRAHPWFAEVEWESLREDEASFIPAPAHAEDTEYFDARGATLQNLNAEFEDQVSSPAPTPGEDNYPDRPHDALSRVRNQVNSIKRGLMPLHIPPHVRDGRSRRLSEPAVADDFGNFSFKNLPVLEKANKDVLSKLRAEAIQAQARNSATVSSPVVASPAPSLDSSPVITMPLQRALSTNRRTNRSASPSLLHQANSSPSRVSQPSSPLLVSFSAGPHHEPRKISGASSNLSTSSLQPPNNFFEVPRLPASFKAASAASSPIKITSKPGMSQLPFVHDKSGFPRRKNSVSSPRQRSHTLGSQDDDLVPDMVIHHNKRRSQVFDVSPSSSDNEDQRQKALLRVQRRRQSSRRMSQVTLSEGPMFRPLDVLICEDHPVSRLVMERLLEKLRCRTISVQNGSEAMRYAMSEVKFDIIMMEFKLPQINGADVARMIRDTKNANSHTPIVAVTGYLKDLMAPHYFDALVEKPPTTDKLTEVMGRLCQWKPPPPGWTPLQMSSLAPSSLRKESFAVDGSPTTTSSFGLMMGTSYRGSSREDSVTSGSLGGDVDGAYDRVPIIVSRHPTNEWQDSDLERNFGGLGISDETLDKARDKPSMVASLPPLQPQVSAPGALENPLPRKRPSVEVIEAKRQSFERDRHESAESGDDEDEELGNTHMRSRSPKSKTAAAAATSTNSSKLGTEMLRTNSQGSVVAADEAQISAHLPRFTASPAPMSGPLGRVLGEPPATGSITPPEMFPRVAGSHVEVIDMDATPKQQLSAGEPDPDPTPRACHSPTQHG